MVEVSIIVPIYNAEKYLSRCIDSILNQTYKNYEVILVNDGSKDDSINICNKYMALNNKIKILNKENGGVSSARNLGIENSKGKYIIFVDPDDSIDNDLLEYCLNIIRENDCEIVCYGMKTYKNDILQSNIYNDEIVEIYESEEIIKEYARSGKFLYSSCNKLFSKKLLDNTKVRFSNEIRYAEDALFNYCIFMHTNRLAISNLKKYNYFINDKSTVKSVTEKRLDILKAQKKIYDILECHKYLEYKELILKQYIESCILIAIDIAREKSILNKRCILKEVKYDIKYNKDMLMGYKFIDNKQKYIFNITKISPLITSCMYRVKFLLDQVAR